MDWRVQRRYQIWRAKSDELLPDGNCCAGEHYKVNLLGQKTDPLGDSEVCKREKAWREYVRERDANYDYPWHIRANKVYRYIRG